MMYKVLYNVTLVLVGSLLAGCAYCAFLLYMLTSGLMSTCWAVAAVVWFGLFVYWVIDCLPKRRRKKRGARRCN